VCRIVGLAGGTVVEHCLNVDHIHDVAAVSSSCYSRAGADEPACALWCLSSQAFHTQAVDDFKPCLLARPGFARHRLLVHGRFFVTTTSSGGGGGGATAAGSVVVSPLLHTL
jgi:hypothetical protein